MPACPGSLCPSNEAHLLVRVFNVTVLAAWRGLFFVILTLYEGILWQDLVEIQTMIC